MFPYLKLKENSFDKNKSQTITKSKFVPFIDDEGKEHLMANAEDLWEYLVYLTDKLMSTQ